MTEKKKPWKFGGGGLRMTNQDEIIEKVMEEEFPEMRFGAMRTAIIKGMKKTLSLVSDGNRPIIDRECMHISDVNSIVTEKDKKIQSLKDEIERLRGKTEKLNERCRFCNGELGWNNKIGSVHLENNSKLCPNKEKI